MRHDTRPALRLLAGPALLAVALTACSSSSAKAPVAGGAPTSAPPTATPTAALGTAAPANAPKATTGAGAGATAAASTAPTRQAVAAATKATTGTGTTTQGITPGTYTYDTTGTVKVFGGTQDASGTTTLAVGTLSAAGQHTTMKNDQSTTDEQLVPRTNGTFLSDLTITTQLFTVEFAPSPAALFFPSPAKAGASWSWKATSTDGKTTAAQSSKVLRTETLVIGGQKVPTVVVQTHLALSGGVDYTADITNWVSPAYHLVVKDHQTGSGTSGSLSYTSDLTDVLRSVRPA